MRRSLAPFLLLVASCPFNIDLHGFCETSADCPRGQQCVDRRCASPGALDAGPKDAGTTLLDGSMIDAGTDADAGARDGGVRLPAGSACLSGEDCQSGNCRDSVCCLVACDDTCQSCSSGACSSVTNAEDPDTCAGTFVCNGTGDCVEKQGQCSTPAECASGFCRDGVCCPEECSGTCRSCANGTCQPVTNADDDDSCSGARSCNASGLCKWHNGQTCSRPDDCLSGFCRDGKCCDRACDGPCRSCAGGVCTVVVNTEDADTCSGVSACDSAGICRKKDGQTCAAGGDCISGQCVNGICCATACTSAQYCSTTGACVARKLPGQPCGTNDECTSGICAGNICKCTTDPQCASGQYCTASVGDCAACSLSDPERCGTVSSAPGCSKCTGATPVCVAGACVAVDGGTPAPDAGVADGGTAADGGAPDGGAADGGAADGGAADGGVADGGAADGGAVDGGCPVLAWTPLAQSGTPPSARLEYSLVFDRPNGRAVLFAGYTNVGSTKTNDTWTLGLGAAQVPTWTRLAPSGVAPSIRQNHSAIYDSANTRMVVFGGSLTGDPHLNDVHFLSLVPGSTPEWGQATPTGSLPVGRTGHTAVYDPIGQRMIVFGGSLPTSHLNDTWALSLPPSGSPAWVQLGPSGTLPAARSEHTAVYDDTHQRMIVFGGANAGGHLGDVWALSYLTAGTPAWTQLSPSGSPPVVRRQHAAIYDALRQRMVVWGGWNGTIRFDDAWALSLPEPGATPTWTQLTPTGTQPSGRYGMRAILDAANSRLLSFGGTDGTYRDDTWQLTLGCCSGCWKDGECLTGTSLSACGSNGSSCLACNDANTCTTDSCSNGSCTNAPGWSSFIARGGPHCAIRTDGSLWCWGRNTYGQLGLGDTTNRSPPTQVGASSWKQVWASTSHTCGIQSDDSLWCWGLNNSGQLGPGDLTWRTAPTKVGAATWLQVSAGNDTSCGLKTDRTLWCWGYNLTGALGLGDTTNRLTPTQVGIDTWHSVSVGGDASCAIKEADRSLWCWGRNNNGQLGLGDTTERWTPTLVDVGRWSQVSVSGYNACGIKEVGQTLWCWGQNLYGQLGRGDTAQRLTPTLVGGDAWAHASSGEDHTCGLKTNGRLWCWGRNQNGALGQGDTTNRLTPTAVTTAKWSSVHAGYLNACALRAPGASLWCWGLNNDGQLGIGNTVDWWAPVETLGPCGPSGLCQAARENFEGLNLGDFTGQAGWNGSVVWDVQSTVVYRGTKALYGSTAAAGAFEVAKTFAASNNGILRFALRRASQSNHAYVRFFNGASVVGTLALNGNSDDYLWYNEAGVQAPGIPVAYNTWQLVDLQLDLGGLGARFRIDEGAWTPWYGTFSQPQATEIRLEVNDPTGDLYVDDVRCLP